MRTTLTLDDDVAREAHATAARLRCSLKQVVNQALRSGLGTIRKPRTVKRLRSTPHRMCLRPGLKLDCVPSLLAQVEGEGHR